MTPHEFFDSAKTSRMLVAGVKLPSVSFKSLQSLTEWIESPEAYITIWNAALDSMEKCIQEGISTMPFYDISVGDMSNTLYVQRDTFEATLTKICDKAIEFLFL